jgi:hypothetical protein
VNFNVKKHFRQKAEFLYEEGAGALSVYSCEELCREWAHDLARLCQHIQELEAKNSDEEVAL